MKQFSSHEDKEAFVQSVFSRIAKRYDMMNTLLSFNRDAYWRRYAVEQMNLKGAEVIGDIACGTCSFTIEALRQFPKLTVKSLDFNKAMLAVGKERLEKVQLLSSVELMEGDAMDLPFEENSLDAVMSGFALRNVPDVKRVLEEMKRVVKPGGKVVTLELAKPEMPVFKQLYYFYFEKLLPLLGEIGISHPTYQWLPESLRRYPHQREILTLFETIGFKEAYYKELTGGIVAVHVGTVPDR